MTNGRSVRHVGYILRSKNINDMLNRLLNTANQNLKDLSKSVTCVWYSSWLTSNSSSTILQFYKASTGKYFRLETKTHTFILEKSGLPRFYTIKTCSLNLFEAVDFCAFFWDVELLLLHPRGLFSKPASLIAVFVHHSTSQETWNALLSHHGSFTYWQQIICFL